MLLNVPSGDIQQLSSRKTATGTTTRLVVNCSITEIGALVRCLNSYAVETILAARHVSNERR